jgi:hypothetical protein
LRQWLSIPAMSASLPIRLPKNSWQVQDDFVGAKEMNRLSMSEISLVLGARDSLGVDDVDGLRGALTTPKELISYERSKDKFNASKRF